MKKRFLQFGVIAIFTIAALSANAQVLAQQSQTQSGSRFQAANQFSTSNLTYKIIDAPHKTYGYEIYVNDKKIISQSSVPALPGNEGFKSKVAAIKVAQLVIQKLQKGEMPPILTIEEMRKLNAIK
ncbi:MAG: DUF4907 domain-containing protein [Chitinophagaceae bacterium]